MRALDDIAEEAAKQYWETGSLLTSKEIIRAAIDRTLETVLTREPSDEATHKGVRAFQSGHNGFDPLADWKQCYRAMQTALLEELKGNSSGTRAAPERETTRARLEESK